MSSTVNSTVFKIFLPVLIGLAIFATLDSIKVNSLDPSVNSLESALNSMDRSMTIGDIYTTDKEEDEKQLLKEKSKEKSKQEVREAILINIVMAQNCDLVTSLNEAEWKNLGPDASNNPDTVYIDYNPDSFKNYEPFMITKDEGEAPITCVGAESPTEIVKPPLQNFRSGPDEATQTNDMEGKFGRINFEVENTLEFKNPRVGATALYENELFDEETKNFPDFWRVDRVVTMVPDGLRKVDEKFIGDDCDSLGPDYHKKSQAILDKDVEDNGFGTTKSTNINVYGGNGLIYAFRVRMQNVPIVKEGYTGPKKDFENGLCTEGKSSEIKDFLMDYSEDPYGNSKAARYVLCENATGYIQSNAGKIDNTGESNVDKFDFSGGYGTEIVFPKLLIRQNPDDCLNKGSESDFVDYRLNGDRCSTEEVLKGEEGSAPVTKNWNGLEVECGVKKETIIQNHNNGRFSFYNTGWFKTGGNLDGDIKGAEPLYEVENGEDGGEPPVAENAKGDLMVRFYDQSGARLTYDLRSYSVEEVDLNFETKGNMNVYLKQDEDNQIQLRIKRTDNEETGKADYEFKVLEDETTVYSKDKTVNLEEGNPFDVFVDLKYTDNKLEWTIEEGDGSEIVDETKEVSSIDVDYIKFRTSGDQNNRATKLNEVSIQE